MEKQLQHKTVKHTTHENEHLLSSFKNDDVMNQGYTFDSFQSNAYFVHCNQGVMNMHKTMTD